MNRTPLRRQLILIALVAVFGLAYLVALAGYGGEDVRRDAIEAGFDAHLTKPASVETLRAMLEAARAPASEKLM